METEGVLIDKKVSDRRPKRAGLRDYVALTKVGITLANLLATVAGLWVGSHGHPKVGTAVFTLVGTSLVVASGATLNNYIDRDIDHRMTRTKGRAVASGTVRPQVALWMGLGLGAAGLVVLAFLVNIAAAACGFVGLIVYAYIYTVWAKRISTLNTVLGGVAGAMPPLIGWAGGSLGNVGLGAWMLFLTFFLWQPPHFLPLAMKRTEEYRAAGIPMLPVVRGFSETKRQIVFYSAAMVPVSLFLYALGYETLVYMVVTLILGLGFLAIAIRGLFVKDDLSWANKLFIYSLVYLTGLCVIIVVGAV